MAPKLVTVAAVVIGMITCTAGPASATRSACPPSFTEVTADSLWAAIQADDAARDAALADGVDLSVIQAFMAAVDKNGDGRTCMQNGSLGRAKGLPAYFINGVENKI